VEPRGLWSQIGGPTQQDKGQPALSTKEGENGRKGIAEDAYSYPPKENCSDVATKPEGSDRSIFQEVGKGRGSDFNSADIEARRLRENGIEALLLFRAMEQNALQTQLFL